MGLDQERIESKIMYIKENIKKLQKFQEISKEEFVTDYRNYDAAKYNLQASIEALIDISNHIISRENLGVPETNAESFKILAQNSIISEDKLTIFTAMARFRNKVVHLYDEIDNAEIYRIITEHLEDFDYFIKQIFNRYF